MNEVKKMYRNAEVLMQDCLRKYYCVFDKSNKNCIVNEKCKIKDCVYLDDNSFTAEKQLELIKLIANRKGYPDYEYFGNLFDNYIQLLEFDEALARLVNSLWQDLTEEERKQIKEILE